MRFVNIKKLVFLFLCLILSITFFSICLGESNVLYQPKKRYKISVTGDSYAGYFVHYNENKYDDLTEFALPQRTIEDNIDIMLKACESPDKILVIAVGVNEFLAEVNPEEFTQNLQKIIDHARNNNKLVFTFSYMDFPKRDFPERRYPIKAYDDAIKKISTENKDIVTYIDMSEYTGNDYIQPDLIHYNKNFYDILYDKIRNFLESGPIG